MLHARRFARLAANPSLARATVRVTVPLESFRMCSANAATAPDANIVADLRRHLEALAAQGSAPKHVRMPLRDVSSCLSDDAMDALGDRSLRQVIAAHADQLRLVTMENGIAAVELRPPLQPSTVEELTLVIPTTEWMPLSELYSSLSGDARDDIRSVCRTSRKAMEGLDHLFQLSASGLFVVQRPGVSQPVDEAILAADPDAEPPAPEDPPSVEPAAHQETTPFASPPPPSSGGSADVPPPPPESRAAAPSSKREVPPAPSIAEITAPPPAPEHPEGNLASAIASADASVPEHALTLEMLNDYIPSFFVPAEEALEAMEGYTLGHIEHYFAKAKTLQVVHIEGRAFIRMHGWYGKSTLNGVADTNERFRKYELLAPDMMAIFKRCFPRPGTWRPLKSIVAAVESDERYQALPFKGPFTLLYFAQQQHLFAFTAENGGAVAAVVNPTHLTPADSPCPITTNELFEITKGNQTFDIGTLDEKLTPEALRQVRAAFPSWAAYVAAHSQGFILHGTVLGQRRHFERVSAKDLSLEEQLEHYYQVGNKKKIRALRRRIAAQQNPDSPLLDPDNLASAIQEFLPPDRPIPLRRLLMNLPRDVSDLLPNSYLKFFGRYPDRFRVFEWRAPNKYYVSRAELPLPDGVIRADYDEISLLAVLVRLFNKRNPQQSTDLYLFSPHGARETIRKLGGIHGVLGRYPENFVLVHSGGRQDAYICTMVSIPDVLTGNAAAATNATGSDGLDMAADDNMVGEDDWADDGLQ